MPLNLSTHPDADLLDLRSTPSTRNVGNITTRQFLILYGSVVGGGVLLLAGPFTKWLGWW